MPFVDYDERTAVCFARDVYMRDDRPPLPAGWSVYYDCPKELQKDGYFGTAYICEFDYSKSHYVYIVIAHRGTDNGSGLLEDAEMKLFDKVPMQFYDGAMPFIEKVFELLDLDYPKQYTEIYFTGHSLGATLSELSIIRYIHYFDRGEHFNPYRLLRNFTYVFDSPGSKNLVDAQLANGEISQSDIDDGGFLIWVWNSDVDVINTCMATSASMPGGYISAAIGNAYSSLTNGSQLPYDPSREYYAWDYSKNDQHKIDYIYDWVSTWHDPDGGRWEAIDIEKWPVGVNEGYIRYKTYYGSNPQEYGFKNHNLYWDQYTNVYWDQNPQIHDEYDDDKWSFKDFYYKNVCYYFDGYALPRELHLKIDIIDLYNNRRLKVDVLLKQITPVTTSSAETKEESNVRVCCGFDFFKAIKSARQSIISATETAGEIVTETGEKLSKVVFPSSLERQKQTQFFFKEVSEFLETDVVESFSPSKGERGKFRK